MLFPRAQTHALSIIVADATGGERLLVVLRGLRDARVALRCEVIAVVGGADAGVMSAFRQEFPLVSLYPAWGETDLGALYNVGCRAAAGKHLLLLDGGVRLDAAAIAELVAFIDQGTFIALVAPRHVTADGRERATARSFPTVRGALAAFDGKAQADTGPRLQHALDRRVTTPKETDAVAGGCVLVKRQALESVGAFAPGYPPGGEVLDWCRRARQGGWSVFFHPGLRAELLGDGHDDPRHAAAELVATCRFIRRHRGLGELLLLELLLALPILRGFMWGTAALIPGTHRAGARHAFWRSWYGLSALLPA